MSSVDPQGGGMTTEVVKRTPMQEVLAEVASDKFLVKLENALPEGVTAKRFASVAVAAIKQNPDLIVAERESLYNAIVRCAQDGLMPDGRDSALVTFTVKGQKRVQYMPMIGGLRKIAAEDGFTLNAQVVYENDEFEYELGAKPWVTHKPAKLGTDRGKPIGAYATATDLAGRTYGPEVMDEKEIDVVRSVSRAKDGDLWGKWKPEAWRKTVARRLFKQLPRGIDTSDRVDRVLRAADDEFDLDSSRPGMTEQEANIAATITQLPPASDEEVALRDDPGERASDAVLNRIARLQDMVGEAGALLTLRGVFGVDRPEDLSGPDAERFARMLEDAAPEIVEGELVPDGDTEAGLVGAGELTAEGETAPAEPDEPVESVYRQVARKAAGK